MMKVLVISGPGGVGKSTVSWEVGGQLATAHVSHAIIDCDELDRVYPQPELLSELIALNRRNLTALWQNFSALGHTRLILTGVMVDMRDELVWLREALENPDITVIRLNASNETLRARLDVREIGSGKDDQLARTLNQAARLRDERDEDAVVIETDGCSPIAIAKEILDRTRWAVG